MIDSASGTSETGNDFYKPNDTVTYEINIGNVENETAEITIKKPQAKNENKQKQSIGFNPRSTGNSPSYKEL